MTSNRNTATKTMLGTLVGIISSGTALSLGSAYGTVQESWLLLTILCAVFAPLCVYGLTSERKNNTKLLENLHTRDSQLFAIAKKYNAVTQMLEDSYKNEKHSLGTLSFGKKESLRKEYEKRYYENRRAYDQERTAFLNNFETQTPESLKQRKYWQWVIGLGLIAQLSACGYTLGAIDEQTVPTTQQQVMEPQEEHYWNAKSIPMPHLTDGSLYVSNPDKVVSENTEALLNQWLKKMDDSLQIESAMIIVNHVEDRDIFRFAQDVFDIYHVGKDDRGLVVVLVYKDHLVRTHTGRSLEADLTDIECSRLQQEYLIPNVKAEQPDSGMLYLTEAIYNTLKHKELPVIYSLKDKGADSDDESGIFILIYMLLFGGWIGLIVYLKHRYGELSGKSYFYPNPFERQPVVVAGGGHGGGFGGGGGSFGGGGFGGGFSGGSSGGGGATSSW